MVKEQHEVARLHQTPLYEYFHTQRRTKWRATLEEMKQDLEDYLEIAASGQQHEGATPYAVFKKGLPKATKKEPSKTGSKYCLTIWSPQGHVSGEYNHCTACPTRRSLPLNCKQPYTSFIFQNTTYPLKLLAMKNTTLKKPT